MAMMIFIMIQTYAMVSTEKSNKPKNRFNNKAYQTATTIYPSSKKFDYLLPFFVFFFSVSALLVFFLELFDSYKVFNFFSSFAILPLLFYAKLFNEFRHECNAKQKRQNNNM